MTTPAMETKETTEPTETKEEKAERIKEEKAERIKAEKAEKAKVKADKVAKAKAEAEKAEKAKTPVVRSNPFETQGAESRIWTFISQGYAPHGYSGNLLRDAFTLKEWVLLESPSGKRVVVGRGTAKKHYGIVLPAYTKLHTDTLENPGDTPKEVATVTPSPEVTPETPEGDL